jgi:hypothetical protein
MARVQQCTWRRPCDRVPVLPGRKTQDSRVQPAQPASRTLCTTHDTRYKSDDCRAPPRMTYTRNQPCCRPLLPCCRPLLACCRGPVPVWPEAHGLEQRAGPGGDHRQVGRTPAAAAAAAVAATAHVKERAGITQLHQRQFVAGRWTSAVAWRGMAVPPCSCDMTELHCVRASYASSMLSMQ